MRVGWILRGPKRFAASRIQGYNNHDYLRSQGIKSKILHKNAVSHVLSASKKEINEFNVSNYDLIVIEGISEGKNLNYLVDLCKKNKVKVISINCMSPKKEIFKMSDATIVTSKALRRRTIKEFKLTKKAAEKLNVVFDGIEKPEIHKKSYSKSKKLKILFISQPPHKSVPLIKTLPRGCYLTIIGMPRKILKVIGVKTPFSNVTFDFKYKEWNTKIHNEIIKHDVSIMPWEKIDQNTRIKSSNRLLLSMSAGLVVMASPVTSYLSIINQGKNGYIIRSKKGWQETFEYLRDHPKKREKIGKQARRDVYKKYSKQAQGEAYLKIFKKVLNQK
jgi:glycosyltransferase involved in cell wall biosynthesis